METNILQGGDDLSPPSDWVQRWSHLAPAGGQVLDVACGHGRHMRWFAQRGHGVTGIDHSAEALASASRFGQVVLADMEGAPWPLRDSAGVRQFDTVVVTNYLWRPLLPTIAQSLAPGGLLLYETFAKGHEVLGRPRRPEFLLEPGELLRVFGHLHIVAFEQCTLENPARCVQRIAAHHAPLAPPAAAQAPGHAL